ncbi:MAG: SRPBCC family protein [Chitinophagales bacterium]|nr:SRPBCC family protein [Chitinophagales bacterium]
MSLLKKLLLGLLVLVVAAVGSTFFMDDNFRVSHTQVVKATPEAVFNQINTIKNWNNWSYWNTLDPEMKTTYNDIPSGVGAGDSWTSEKKDVGNGSMIIKESTPNTYISFNLDFAGEGKAFSEYILKPVDGGTEVTTGFNMETKGIMMKLMSRTLMKRGMTKAFEASMTALDKYLQANPTVAAPIEVVDSTVIKTDSIK